MYLRSGRIEARTRRRPRASPEVQAQHGGGSGIAFAWRLRVALALSLARPHRHLGSPEQLADDDWRKTNPRFTAGNFEKNLRIVDEVQAVASEVDASPAQVALAWLLAQGDDIAPIPGTKRVSRIEENTAADGIELSADQIQRLNDLTPATGERHDETNMSVIDG
jgi:aryl-alcohol dehydrogenase-like predicted oxidoreductase